jgi:hypothetical protein
VRILGFMIGVFAIIFTVFAVMALVLSYCTAELHGPLGVPALGWWHSLLLIVGLGVLGSGFHMSLGAAVQRKRS